jgi:protein gp37
MAFKSKIEWTEATWNPVTGCTKVSAGCENCYAERMALRLKEAGMEKYRKGFRLAMHPDFLNEPLSWRKPQIVFVCSMSDLFHEEVPTRFIEEVFGVMRQAECHQFQVLTKRAERAAELSASLFWPDNVWMGVTVERQDYLYRIDRLRETGAKIKFLSLEPLLGPMPMLDLRGIDWVIVGGESGPGARALSVEWVRDIRNQCEKAGAAFFFKQWGGVFKKRNGRRLDGRTWDEMPGKARIPSSSNFR